jgi:hypothetical protein
MDAVHRLSRFGRAAKERALPAWKSVQRQSGQNRRNARI